MSDLPPLSAIRAFEAAARHESFTKAAAELGMTQAAVSYQVKLLEDRLGAPLFLRLPRRVVLSETGKRLAPSVGEAFQRLRAAFAAMRETADGVLSITAINTFATNWLVPRLGAFQVAHPGIAVRIDPSGRMVDFAREEFDLGIRGGRGVWPGLKAHLLMPVEFTPMCSPELLARSERLKTPADLLELPLLDWRDDWWRQWFALAGIPDPKPARRPAIEIDSQVMLGRAAMAGQGIAILTPAFFAAEIAAGRLIQPFDLVARGDSDSVHSGYWLVYPEERRNSPKIRAFRDWILAEMRDCLEPPKPALKLVR
jgi:LysR family transcriptional regulator, glycine cleavage system transcriptional activator